MWLRNPGDLPFDRIINSNSDLPTSTLYVDINSPLFGHFHQTLSETAKAGRTSYRIRYRPSLSPSQKPLSISGYGAEFALKRTDYIVIDDRAAEKDKESKQGKDAEDVSFKAEDMDDLRPLSTSEVLGLGIKTSSYILRHENPLETLEKISQDFPKHSSSLSRVDPSIDFLDEHRSNRELYLGAGYNVIWMNGLQVDFRQMDAFALLDKLRHERKLIGSLKDVGFTSQEAVSLISHVATAQSKTNEDVQRYDYRDAQEGGDVILWLNDIEKDKRYEEWPTHSSAVSNPLPSVLCID